MIDPDFTDFNNWHSLDRQAPEKVLVVDKIAEVQDPIKQQAIRELVQYLPPEDGSAAVSSHPAADDNTKIYQEGHGDFSIELLNAMNSLRLTHTVPPLEQGQPFLIQDNLNILMDDNDEPHSWKITKWRVDFGPARGRNLPANVDPLFYYDTVSWSRRLRYPDGTEQNLAIDTVYGWTIYRH